MNIVLIVGLKFFDLSDVVYTQVIYITYNMCNRDLPDRYAYTLGPAALGLGHIYPLAHVITYTYIPLAFHGLIFDAALTYVLLAVLTLMVIHNCHKFFDLLL